MKKRFFAVILAALMTVAAFSLTAFAAETDGHATSVSLTGVTLNSDFPYYINGEAGGVGTRYESASDWNAYFNAATGELTLKGLNINSTGTGVLFAEGNLKIILEGTENTITANQNAVHIKQGKLEITGNSAFNIILTSAGTAIRMEKHKATSEITDEEMMANTSLTIDGSTVTMVGGIENPYDNISLKNEAKLNIETGYIYAHNLFIENGYLDLKEGIWERVISVSNEFKITKGSVVVVDSQTSTKGIGGSKKIIINGGSVKINCLDIAFGIAPTFGSGYEYYWKNSEEAINYEAAPFVYSQENGYAEIIGAPEVTYPNGSSFEKGKAPAGFGVSIDMDMEGFGIENFERAEISSDGEIFTPLTQDEEFEVISGSILIKLKEDYLNTLAAGEYTLRVHLENAGFEYTDAKFTVTAAGSAGPVHEFISAITQSTEENPNTGAETALSAAVALAVISGAALLLKKKK